MDNFNLRGYLAENKLLKEDITSKLDKKIQSDPKLLDKVKAATEKAEKGDSTDLAMLMAMPLAEDAMTDAEEEGYRDGMRDEKKDLKEGDTNTNRILELIQMYVDNYSDEGMSAEEAIRKIDELLQGNLDGYDKSFMGGEEDQY